MKNLGVIEDDSHVGWKQTMMDRRFTSEEESRDGKKKSLIKLRNGGRTNTQLCLLVYIALLEVGLVVLEELVPVTSKPWNANLKPRLHVSGVVDDCCHLDLCPPNVRILPKTNHVPPPVKGQRVVIKCELAQRQASCFP